MLPSANIEEHHLQSLVDNGISESKTIEFKRDIYHENQHRDKNKWRRELCADVSALANVSGGWIIIGMDEDEEGRALDLCGVTPSNLDELIRQYEAIINTGIEPRIQGISIHEVELKNSTNPISIVIQVPKSFAAPHRVIDDRHFYIRRTKGKDRMDIDEIRSAFNLSETYIERIRTFREERIELLRYRDEDGNSHDDVPLPLQNAPLLVIHSIPFDFANIDSKINLQTFIAPDTPNWLSQLHLNHFVSHGFYNFDGYVAKGSATSQTYPGYHQVFYHGSCEYVVSLGYGMSPLELEHPLHVDPIWLINKIGQQTNSIISLQQKLRVNCPLAIFVTLLGISNIVMKRQDAWAYQYDDDRHNVRRQSALIPEVIINEYEFDIEQGLKPIFDRIWSLGGYPPPQ